MNTISTYNMSGGVMKSIISIIDSLLYRIIEHMDGERTFKIIPYRIGQKIKIALLKNIY